MTISTSVLESTESPQSPNFDILPLSNDLRKAIAELGYTHPTPVQRAVYEPATRGLDLVVQARTGTGKTASFGMPLLDVLVRRHQPGTQALILCPTRELALQVFRELERLGKYRGLSVVAIYGGAPMFRQIEALKAGAQIVVGTPGRVLDHLRRETLIATGIRVCILDESDEMLSMGFLPQITDIQSYLPSPHQTLLFSATLPADIQRMAETRLIEPVFLTLSGDHIGALDVQHLTYFSMRDKLDDLLRVLDVEDPESAIIFCNTKDETKRVAAALDKRGFGADWLNADLAQTDREKVMESTRLGILRFLVCTDVAARGIDLSHLTHVINFDFPESPESYVHRTGRTGRAGRTGTAISLITPGDIGYLYILRLTYKICPIERQLPSRAELKTRAELDLVEMFVEAFSSRPQHEDDVMLARRLLSHESAEFVVAGLLRDHLGTRPDASSLATDNRRSRLPTRVSSIVTPHAATCDASAQALSLGNPESTKCAPQEPCPVATDASTAQHATGRRKRRQSSATTEPKLSEFSSAVEAEFDFQYTVGDAEGGGAKDSPRGNSAEIPRPNQGGRRDKCLPGAGELDATAEVGSEVFLNVGRRDGVNSEDVLALLAQRAIPKSVILHVSVRHHHTFVGVRRPSFQTVLGILDGANLAGRVARAEPARTNRD
jgi:ATP-dependent RNA helicase DeaD